MARARSSRPSSGVRKAAILTLLLGEDASAELFKHLNEDEIELIAREVALARPGAGRRQRPTCSRSSTTMWQRRRVRHPGRRRLRAEAADQDARRRTWRARVLDRVVKSFESTVGFTALEKADPQQLSKFILGEHPQTIALILAHLKPASAAQLRQLLPDDLRVDVLTRMASLDEISPDVITRISTVIEQRLKALGGPTPRAARRRPRRGRAASTASIAASASRCSKRSRTQSPELAVSIRNLMFVFDDLLHVDDNGMREIIQRADKKALTVALKGAQRGHPRRGSSRTCRSAPRT